MGGYAALEVAASDPRIAAVVADDELRRSSRHASDRNRKIRPHCPARSTGTCGFWISDDRVSLPERSSAFQPLGPNAAFRNSSLHRTIAGRSRRRPCSFLRRRRIRKRCCANASATAICPTKTARATKAKSSISSCRTCRLVNEVMQLASLARRGSLHTSRSASRELYPACLSRVTRRGW